MILKRVKVALHILLTGKNPLEAALLEVELRNKDLKQKLLKRTEILHEKLEITRGQVRSKEDAIASLNKRIKDINAKLEYTREIVQKKDNNIKKLNTNIKEYKRLMGDEF